MSNGSKRKKTKIFLMLIVIMITTITLAVETYAWFVGLSTVNTDSFNINVSSGGGLEISLDGEHWKKDNDVLTISASTITATSGSGDHAYSGNTNSWVGANGLVPVSTNGSLNSTTGRLIFFEKSTLSSTPGGYRIVANQVDNSVNETGQYVVFDLFIRNGTDNVFSTDNYSSQGGESIYLKKTSSASVNGTINYGAANSVRVGFFLIAGMKAYGATTSQITSLSCNSANSSTVKKICSNSAQKVYWNIWEPNYKSHTSNAVSYFNQICKKRDVSTGEYLSDSCSALTETSSFTTYPIFRNILASDNVDIYDVHNGYRANLYNGGNAETSFLATQNTYRIDSTTTYNQSNQLFKLAGNSITKVRVYIWLEGQDVDNYDIVTKNSNVIVNFGLTKDRYEING